MHTFIASIIIFGLIIFVHEFGHYIVAKLTDVKVEEFSLGMGPKLVSRKWGETLYALRALPLGGFCKMSGEQGHEDYRPEESIDRRRFDQKPIGVRAMIIIAGPFMNFLLAVLLFTSITMFLGTPLGYLTRIGEVIPNTPAAQAGLLPGDKVLSINQQPLQSWEDMVKVIYASAGKPLNFSYERAQISYQVQITPLADADHQGKIGVAPADEVDNILWQRVGFLSSIKEGVYKTYQITHLTLVSLADMLRGRLSTDSIAGPVGIVTIIGESAKSGWLYIINLTALISISLGFFNLLPIPALDGGRLLFIAFEGIFRRPVSPQKENFVHLVGFMLLMLLMILVTYRDILRLMGLG